MPELGAAISPYWAGARALFLGAKNPFHNNRVRLAVAIPEMYTCLGRFAVVKLAGQLPSENEVAQLQNVLISINQAPQ